MRVAIIVDRTGPDRLLADWLAERACEEGYDVDLIDLAQAADLEPWLEDADVLVVVTPCELPPGKPTIQI
ncbi:hypothetical protein ACIBH1_33705 [Nonomuraea sp. NPDC050663]|uniref:hypothetical protein n=1 Tax=Nonomuraea sp. NPDC050663 TaxID=3364370 RepID=UPI0017ABB5DB|nr:hypothetical protein [Thermoactinospora sp.]